MQDADDAPFQTPPEVPAPDVAEAASPRMDASSWFRRKPVPTDSGSGSSLQRVLGPVHLTLLGVGAIIGTGIFVLTGTAAAGGPGHLGAGLMLSFLLTAFACGLVIYLVFGARHSRLRHPADSSAVSAPPPVVGAALR